MHRGQAPRFGLALLLRLRPPPILAGQGPRATKLGLALVIGAHLAQLCGQGIWIPRKFEGRHARMLFQEENLDVWKAWSMDDQHCCIRVARQDAVRVHGLAMLQGGWKDEEAMHTLGSSGRAWLVKSAAGPSKQAFLAKDEYMRLGGETALNDPNLDPSGADASSNHEGAWARLFDADG
eukprot:4478692-Amphidinium_carterae.3